MASTIPINITKGGSAVGATFYTTASISPPPNTLIFAHFASRTGITADPTQPTCTGCGLTWSVLPSPLNGSVVYDNTSSSRKRLTTFYAMGPNPTTGALTFDEAGQAQTHAEWIVDQIPQTPLGNSCLDAILQAVSNFDGSATVTSIIATLNLFSNPNNLSYGVFAEGNGNTTWTVGSGFTEVTHSNTSTAIVLLTEYNLTNDNTIDATDSATSEVGVIGMEIRSGRSLGFTSNNLRPAIFKPGLAR